MHFLFIVAVLAALVISENAPAQPVPDPGARLILALAGMLLVPLVAGIASAWSADQLRQHPWGRQVVINRLKAARALHAALWLIVGGAILYGLGWPQMVRFNWGLDRAVLLDELLILAPVLLPMALSWAAFYDADCALREGVDGSGETPYGRWQYVAVHARHFLGILLIPVLGLLAVRDVTELLVPGFRESHLSACVYAVAITLLLVLFPVLLRYVWQTRSLGAGPLRERLEAAARRAGFRARDILVWQTDQMVVNAAVAGFWPGLRYVFLTDGLLAQLTEEEVQAVFGHEIGHMRHRHLWLRMLAILAPVSLGLLVYQLVPGLRERLEMTVAFGGGDAQSKLGILVLMAMASYMLLVFGPYCRLLEGQADLFGCRTLAWESAPQPVETFISALENLAIASGMDREAPSWQHASIARRVEFLKRVAQNPDYELHFQRRVRWLSGLMIGAVVSPLALQFLLLG